MLIYQTRQGVFGPMANGGGIFDNAISGLGALGATMQKGIVPTQLSSKDAAVKQCVDQSCRDLAPDQLFACANACLAKVNAASASKTPPPSGGGGGASVTTVSPTAAEAAMYRPGFKLDQKVVAIAVGGIAAAAFVYLYAKKKG